MEGNVDALQDNDDSQRKKLNKDVYDEGAPEDVSEVQIFDQKSDKDSENKIKEKKI